MSASSRHGLTEVRAHDDRNADDEQDARYDDWEQSRARFAEAPNRVVRSLEQEKERKGRKQQAPPRGLIDHSLPHAVASLGLPSGSWPTSNRPERLRFPFVD